MRPHVRIRELRSSDGKAIIQGYLDLYRERDEDPTIGIYLFERPPTAESESRWFEGLLRAVSERRKIVAVAEVDGRAVGICEVTVRGPPERGELSHVADLGLLVHRGYRRQGIGEALLRDVLAGARGRFELVVLSVFSVNEGAKHLYQKVGFLRYGTLPAAVKRGGRYFDSDEMYIDLRASTDRKADLRRGKLNRRTPGASAPSPSHGG